MKIIINNIKNSAKEIYINNILVNILFSLFIFFIFFPYIRVIPVLQTDVQPYALIFALIIFFAVKQKKCPKLLALLSLPLLLAFLLFPISGIEMNSVRSLMNYISLFFISISVYFFLKINQGFNLKILKIITYIWFTIGFIQTFFYKNFLTFLLSRNLVQGARGVIALATEPTYYGLLCLFLMILTYFQDPKEKGLQVILLIQIVFFAKSSLTILLICIFLLFYIVLYFSFKKLVLFFVFAVSIYTFIMTFMVNTRLFSLAQLLISNPQFLVISDVSGNDRFFHIFFSILGFFKHWFLPAGFSAWRAFLDQNIPLFSSYVIFVSPIRIMSGFGAVLFELGFVGLIIPFVLIIALKKFYKNETRKFLLFAIFISLIILMAMPIAFPLIGFLYGYLSYYAINKQQNQENSNVVS